MRKDHDHAYKLLFSEPEMVIDLLQGFVHEPWVNDLDFSTLEVVSGSYVTDDLRDREDDVIWRVKYQQSWIYVYLLIEFQSTIDHHMAVRIMTYMGLLYQDLIKGKQLPADKRLPPIFPIVLYNGEKRWDAATELKDLMIHVPGGLASYLPSLKYLLLDEGAYNLSELVPLKNLVAAIFRLEKACTPEEVTAVVANLIEWLKIPEQTRLRRSFSLWINRVLKLSDELNPVASSEINDLVEIKTMLSQRIPEWIEAREQRGRAEGKAEGEARGEVKGEARTLLKLLHLKFDPLPDWVEQTVNSADKDQLDGWVEAVLTAENLEDLFL